MEIWFATTTVRELCESQKSLTRTHGKDCARQIMRRLIDLRAAQNLTDMRPPTPGKCHELLGDRAGQLSLSVSSGKRLIFQVRHDPRPEMEDGGLDWGAVTEITVIEITDYH